MLAFETIASPAPWEVLHLPGPASDLVISFASIGHDASRAPSPEFVRAASAEGRPALFVQDATRSWASAPGFAEALTAALATLRARQKITRILAIGTSMGAFMALRAAEVLPLDAVLAISPQYHPAAAWEGRWRDWTPALPEGLTAPLPAGPRITLMHGLLDDARQSALFPQRPNVDHLLFPDQDHSTLGRHLKARGLYLGLIAAGLSGDRRRLLRLLQEAGGQRRAAALA